VAKSDLLGLRTTRLLVVWEGVEEDAHPFRTLDVVARRVEAREI
jgi:hypothetical protein